MFRHLVTMMARTVASLRRREASRGCLDDDCPGHMRMQGTKILISTRRRECERILVLAIEGLGPEIVGRNNRVRNVILVGPGDRSTRLHFQFLRSEGEVSDLHHGIIRPGRHRGQEQQGRDAGNNNVRH